MRKIDAPLRVTWDWDRPPVAHPGAPSGRPSPELVRDVGAELVRARVLMLEIGYPDAQSLLDGEVARAVEGLVGSVSLVLRASAAVELAAAKPTWESFGGGEVWLDATPVGAPGSGAAPIPEAIRPWTDVRIYLTAKNCRDAADVCITAVEGGARRLSLPNLPLFGELLGAARELAPTPAHLRAFADLVAPALAANPGIDLRVHHYGLTELFRARGLQPHGEEAPGHAGCQAGAALAYIDPCGVLYPCASLPIPLARMEAGALTRAWAGDELRSLREVIAALPAACRGCPAENACRGGCRGWAQFLAGSWDATGPDCLRRE